MGLQARVSGGGYPGSTGSPGCETSARVLEGQSRQGLLADRAVSEIGSRPHRPLPAASPASEAGARLTCHLLRIAAAASSRASPAPGMQRLRQAGRCLGRAVSPHQAFSSSDGVGRWTGLRWWVKLFRAGFGEPLASNISAGRPLRRMSASVTYSRDVCHYTLAADCPSCLDLNKYLDFPGLSLSL